MLMKKIFILLMVGSLLFSCQITDVLNQEPPHNLTPDNAITDEKSAETALTGIYGEQIGYESYMSIGNHAMTAGILQRNDNPGVVVSIYYIENRLPELIWWGRHILLFGMLLIRLSIRRRNYWLFWKE